MLKGLEVSEVRLSELKLENRTFRIDSNFFSKRILELDKEIKSRKHFFIPENKIVSGPFGSSLTSDSYLTEGVPFIRIENIKNGFSISKENMIYISENDNTRLKSSQLKLDDLILSKVGNTIGFYARVDEEINNCNISENNIGIKLDDFSTEKKHYILTYLNSKFGFVLTYRRVSGNAQPKLNVFDVSEIPIPEMTDEFMKNISSQICRSKAKLSESKSLYAQAEDILLSELGLKDWQPKNEAVSIKTFSDFALSGRLDAEYYQSKYDEIEAKIKALSHKVLDEVADIQDSNFNPKAKVTYKYIELANIGSSGEITGYTEDLGENLPSRARRVVHTGDVLVSSIEGSLQSCAIVSKEYDGALCSTGFYVLKAVAMNPESLLILLKSEIMQQLLKKGCSGTILTAISKDEFNRVIIPILPQDIQKQIAELIQRSFALRQESKQLLESAKLAVEQEIER